VHSTETSALEEPLWVRKEGRTYIANIRDVIWGVCDIEGVDRKRKGQPYICSEY
jgi:hypothetical protein